MRQHLAGILTATYVVISFLMIVRLLVRSSFEKPNAAYLAGTKNYNSEYRYGMNLDFPAPIDNEYFEPMQQKGAMRSVGHMEQFFARRDQIAERFPEEMRYQPVRRAFAAIIISDSFAFLHVWKCGGTTVEKLTEAGQMKIGSQEVRDRKWVALVRDPIDRFLSAWAECGVRLYENEITFDGFESMSALNWLDGEYDFRVRAFLREVQDYLPPARSCHTHAFPQANYMINSKGNIDKHVTIVGDLSEMRESLELASLRIGPEDLVVRDASEDLVKNHFFQSRREELSNQTLVELCRFLAMDYFLFNFVPPEACVAPGGPLEDLLQ